MSIPTGMYRITSVNTYTAADSIPAQLFVDQNYGGASMALSQGSYNVDRLSAPDAVGNDTVSSIKVAPGYVVTVFTDPDLGGASRQFSADTPYVGDDFNDKISSVSVDKSPAVTARWALNSGTPAGSSQWTISAGSDGTYVIKSATPGGWTAAVPSTITCTTSGPQVWTINPS